MTTDLLRPRGFNEYIGQPHLVKILRTFITAAVKDGTMLGHVLLTGPAGIGKTSLVHLIAESLGEPLLVINLASEKPPQILSKLRDFTHGGVVLLDEVHRAHPSEQDRLLDLLDHGNYVFNGRGCEIEQLTVVAATTDRELLNEPFTSRFLIEPGFDAYTPDEMASIVQLLADRLEVVLTPEDAKILGKAADGSPRKAKKLVYTLKTMVSASLATPTGPDVLTFLRIDEDGLGKEHYDYLRALKKNGGLAAMVTIQNLLNIAPATRGEIEGTLLKAGLIVLGSQGRELTAAGRRKLNPEGTPTRRLRAA